MYGVVDKPTITSRLKGRGVLHSQVKVVAHLLGVTAPSPQSVTYGWHIRISFVFLIGAAQRNTEIKASGGKCWNRTTLPVPKTGVQNHYTSFSI